MKARTYGLMTYMRKDWRPLAMVADDNTFISEFLVQRDLVIFYRCTWVFVILQDGC